MLCAQAGVCTYIHHCASGDPADDADHRPAFRASMRNRVGLDINSRARFR